jgi:hypothetical protein
VKARRKMRVDSLDISCSFLISDKERVKKENG